MRSSSAAIRSLTLLLFLALVSVIAYWAMQLLVPRGAIAPTDSIGDNNRPPLPVASRLFGARSTAVEASAPPPINVRVMGILDAGRRGVAILSIDDQPARAYAVNQRTEGGSVIKAVQHDKVVIDHNGQRIEAQPPRLWSIDILSSNAGRSSLPTGIEAVEEPLDDDGETIHDTPGQTPGAAPPPVSGMNAPGGMAPSYPSSATDPSAPSAADMGGMIAPNLSADERQAAMQALGEDPAMQGAGQIEPMDPGMLAPPPDMPPPGAVNRRGMAFPRMYDSATATGEPAVAEQQDGY
ncbi:MAG: type II secretion system protein N [Lautropia sp.]|nr:type II secretion system protein N [Lautropia sp.]